MGIDQRRWRWWNAVVLIGMVSVTVTVTSSDSHEKQEQEVSRIAFGSCSNQNAPQPIWDAVVDFRPQIFIWLGDNIYGDFKRPFKIFGRERTVGPWKNVPRFVPSSEQEMKARYEKAKSSPGYVRLHQNAKVIGTWDDHDYGLNDAGKEFQGKITNQKLLLDFLDEPQDSPRRKQAGVYASYTYGPVGRDIKWLWLEKELKGPATALTIIGSSIQVISNLSATIHPLFAMESWGRFPKERDRIFKLIADSKRAGVFFISGDVHFGEITRYDCAVGYPLYDVTSSGVTQSVEEVVPPFLRSFVRFVALLTPSTMRVKGQHCRYKSCIYGRPNFGTIEIDWDSHPVTLKLKVRDKESITVTGVDVSLTELQLSNSESFDRAKAGHDNQKHCTLEVSLPWFVRYRLAILFCCTLIVFHVAFLALVYTCFRLFRLEGCKRKHD
ncbi:hypothetical protein PHAVU_008G212600 [Phaseolus vulgaris]